MDEQERREAWLKAAGWTFDAGASFRWAWSHPKHGTCANHEALGMQLMDDADAAIDAMLRLARVAGRLWDTAAWCDSEMRDAMAALAAEVTP